MILTENIKIKIISGKNLFFYKKTLNKNLKYNDVINITPYKLPHGSRQKILVKCDVCGAEKLSSYKNYYSMTKQLTDIYCCYNCRRVKTDKTNLEKYGNCCAMQNKSIKDKSKQTKIRKYNNENFNNTEKNKKTCLLKYGVDNISKLKEIKNKKIKTSLSHYGFETPIQNENVKFKLKQTNLKKYGVEYPTKNKDVIKKMKSTNIEKYGVENVFQNENIKEKTKHTNIEKYGFSNVMKNIEIKERMKKSRIENGNQVSDDNLNEFEKYRKLVNIYTLKNKKELFANWNGYDHYDNEYIKENFIFGKESPLYPTVDHKISVFYGFNNNIDSKDISKIDNLCITKKSINSQKHKNITYERKEKN